MKKILVVTTINKPTIALKKFNKIPDWELLVVGDLKTPHAAYSGKEWNYYGPTEQQKDYPILSMLIGWNKVQRRNLGFLKAYELGADIIASSDDDNIPNDEWGKDLLINKEVEVNFFKTEEPCFDPLYATKYKGYWHRGFPIQLLKTRDNCNKSIKKMFKPTAQANFWNGDPDVDTICRLQETPKCDFSDETCFPFASNKISPFDSQNTFISRDTIKDYFMFPDIGRMDDIWGAYFYLSSGHKIVYDKPTVCQERNEHDLTTDFIDEMIGYTGTNNLLKEMRKYRFNIGKYLPGTSYLALLEYRRLFNELNTEFRNMGSATNFYELAVMYDLKFDRKINHPMEKHDWRWGDTNKQALMSMCGLIKANEFKVFEFGTFRGLSTYHFALNSRYSVHTIDVGEDITEEFDSYEPGELFKGTLIEDNIQNTISDSKTFDYSHLYGHFGFVFVDGGHDYETCKSDTINAFKLLGDTGVIVWDDYNNDTEGFGIKQVIKELDVPLVMIGGYVAYVKSKKNVYRGGNK